MLGPSVIPEVHVILDKPRKGIESAISSCADVNGNHFVSIFDNGRDVEWKVSQTYNDHASASSPVTRWLLCNSLNTCVFLGVLKDAPFLLGRDEIDFVDSVTSAFILPKSGKSVCASAWTITGDIFDDLLSSGRVTESEDSSLLQEIVPVTISVKLSTLCEYQKFISRIQSCPSSFLFIRFAVFDPIIGSVYFVHIIMSRMGRNLIDNLRVIPEIRSEKKINKPISIRLSLIQKYLIPLLAGNSKLFLFLPILHHNDGVIMDICEKICLVALACTKEKNAKIDDYEVIQKMDLLINRKDELKVVEKNIVCEQEVEQLETEVSRLDMKLVSQVDDSTEIFDLKAKNLTLKAEIDRLKMGNPVDNKLYASHLVSEVKTLRANLLAVESDKRKYLTSRRLVESLVEKTNKLKSDLDQKSGKLKEAESTNKMLKNELNLIRIECENLVKDNESLVCELEKPVTDPSLQFKSLYQEFLFPFDKSKQLQSGILSVHDSLKKIQRHVQIHSPSIGLEVARGMELMESVRAHVNTLLAASDKLQISAGCILSNTAPQSNAHVPTAPSSSMGESWRT